MSARPGFFIPYRYAEATRPCDYPVLHGVFSAAAERFEAFLARLDAHRTAFDRFGGEPPAPRFGQDWFPRLDACAAYAMVRERRPSLIVEIGCGHSTRVMARAIADGGLATRHLCIDPAPRAALAGLAIEHRSATLDQLDRADHMMLAMADLLFVDSSHIGMPGSDVDRLINDVLPRLKPGAVIHFHDVFLPYAYPKHWSWRGYNEQSLVAPLMTSGGYQVLFSSHYVVRQMADRLEDSFIAGLPLLPEALESSLWLEKTPLAYWSNQNVSGR